MPAPLPAPIQDFLDQFSQMLETEGLPRAAGRMLGFLFVRDGEYTADELVAHLTLSRASVSTGVRTLGMLGLAQRVKRPGERVARIRLHKDPFVPMLHAGVIRAQRMQGMVAECRATLRHNTVQRADGRLAELEHFFAYSATALASMRDAWPAGQSSGTVSTPPPKRHGQAHRRP